MGVVSEALQELDDVGVDVGVIADVVDPLIQLGLIGQLALGQQVGDLEEAGVLGQLLDRVPPIAED